MHVKRALLLCDWLFSFMMCFGDQTHQCHRSVLILFPEEHVVSHREASPPLTPCRAVGLLGDFPPLPSTQCSKEHSSTHFLESLFPLSRWLKESLNQ